VWYAGTGVWVVAPATCIASAHGTSSSSALAVGVAIALVFKPVDVFVSQWHILSCVDAVTYLTLRIGGQGGYVVVFVETVHGSFNAAFSAVMASSLAQVATDD
jgi:uncharacterized membrane protein